ncbi:hypothetical protein QZH41_004779, partial [Actinostola sp. cb2023]
WRLQFIESDFRAQLPKPYGPGGNATYVIPTDMNDRNEEERSRYLMSSTALPEAEAIPRSMAENHRNYSSSLRSEPEANVEPMPEWNIALEIWGPAWEIHCYGLGSAFAVIAMKMPEALSNVLWGIAQPCLIASYGLLFVVLRNAIRLKQRFQTWFNTRNITLVVVPHFLFVFTSDLAVSFSPKLKALTFVFGVEAKLFVSSDIKTPRSVLKKNEAQKHSFRSV